MICVDMSSIQNQKAAILYGKTFVNYIYNRDGNIDILTKGLPLLSDIENVVNNKVLLQEIKDSNSTIEQYLLYEYSETDKDFNTWLNDNISIGILSTPVIPNIYLTKEKESLLLNNFPLNDVLKVNEEVLLNFLENYNGEQYDEENITKLNSILDNRLLSVITLKEFYNSPLLVNRQVQEYLDNYELQRLANENIIEKQC